MTLTERIAFKFEKLNEYTGYLKIYGKKTCRELETDFTLRAATERYLQLSAECLIHISEMIIANQRFRKPEEYRETIEILGEEGILTRDF
ncbi:MAG: DUF86 domain-containing protein [Proteobacteria bacterium]|nr:DUF86 domain-containing protein [Pseudomonadota bacterium]